MIYLYTGTPGSGKSYHAVQDIIHKLKGKQGFNRVIANFNIICNPRESFFYIDNSEITVDYFVNFSRENHKSNIESQSLVVIDEAQIIFNSRSWNQGQGCRLDWIQFFSQHRKLGYNIILIAQFDRMIDRQIRCLVEYEVAHMKVNNYFRILPISAFLCVTRWYGQKMKLSHEIMIYRKKIAQRYDTFAMFNQN